MRFFPRHCSLIVGLLCGTLVACGDDDAGADAGRDAEVSRDAQEAIDVPEDVPAVDGAMSDVPSDAALDARPSVEDAGPPIADVGPTFEGDPPPERIYRAGDDADFMLLGDDDAFTSFSVEGSRVQVLPLRDENFPEDVNYCRAESDDELNGLQQFARARLVAVSQSWLYDVTLDAVAESDGESVYQLVVNGEVVAESSNPPTASTAGLGDMDSYEHTWNAVVLRDTDEVELRAKAHSNLTLIEGAACRTWDDTYAWARGRWLTLRLTPAELP